MKLAALGLALLLPATALAQDQPQPNAEEIAAQAAIQIGQLQTAVGRLQLENIGLRKKIAAAEAEKTKAAEPPKK